MDTPVRKYQKQKDYQRHKLFRKMKRRRRAAIEQAKDAPMKQLRRKLKIPKFEDGKDENKELPYPLRSSKDYDDNLAYRSGIIRDPKTGHMWSTTQEEYPNRRTYLKRPNHPTFNKALWGDLISGYDVYFKNGNTYSAPTFSELMYIKPPFKFNVPKFEDGKDDKPNVFQLADGTFVNSHNEPLEVLDYAGVEDPTKWTYVDKKGNRYTPKATRTLTEGEQFTQRQIENEQNTRPFEFTPYIEGANEGAAAASLMMGFPFNMAGSAYYTAKASRDAYDRNYLGAVLHGLGAVTPAGSGIWRATKTAANNIYNRLPWTYRIPENPNMAYRRMGPLERDWIMEGNELGTRDINPATELEREAAVAAERAKNPNRRFVLFKAGAEHGGRKQFAKGQPWAGTTVTHGEEQVLAIPGKDLPWVSGRHYKGPQGVGFKVGEVPFEEAPFGSHIDLLTKEGYTGVNPSLLDGSVIYSPYKIFGRNFGYKKLYPSAQKKTPWITAENAANITPEQWTAAQDMAIRRGDMAEAQRLRDLHFRAKAPNTKAINADGSPTRTYHTVADEYDPSFTEFNPDIEGTHSAIYTSDDPFMSGTSTRLRELAKYSKYKDDKTNKKLSDLYKVYTDKKKARKQILADHPWLSNEVQKERQKQLYVNLQNPVTINNNGSGWNHINLSDLPEDVWKNIKVDLRTGYLSDSYSTRSLEAAQMATGNYDGSIVSNVLDYGGRKGYLSEFKPGTVYQVNNPENLKLADAITYADDGTRIPLGSRDNFNIKDIRYGLLTPLAGGTALLGYNSLGQPIDTYKHGKDSGIHINPKNRGKFNALKKRTGKTTEQLTHSKNPLTRKRAIFAQNAKKWKH